MTFDRNHMPELDAVDAIVEAMASLGVTPESIQQAAAAQSHFAVREDFQFLEDTEWQVLEALLPLNASQANTMDNRTFVNEVLLAQHRGGRWTKNRKGGPQSDAVRRRFGRWAHLGIWQRVSGQASEGPLGSERKAALKLVADRAERLRLKSL